MGACVNTWLKRSHDGKLGGWRRISTSRNGAVVAKGETASTDIEPSTTLNQSGLPIHRALVAPHYPAMHHTLSQNTLVEPTTESTRGHVSWLDDLHNKQYQRSAYSDRGHMTFDLTRLDRLFLNTWGLAKWNLLHTGPPQSHQADNISSSV